jgi:iron complex outermembrane receptor protein
MGFKAQFNGLAVVAVLAGYSGLATAAGSSNAGAGDETLAEIVVTGTNIRGAAPTGSSVISVDREQIENSSGVTALAILQETPQIMNFGITESSRTGNGGAGNITFGASVNLRGISPFATLTLINGHRMPPNGTTGAAPDPNVLPTIALERVEVVADGASAIYGSDAIVGVANLILRRHVQGFEANLRYGTAAGYDDRQFGAIFGHDWGSGRMTISAENGFHSSLHGPARDFFHSDLRGQGGADNRVTQCVPGNVVIGAGAAAVTYPIPSGAVTPGTLVAGAANRCDNIKNLDIIPEQDHKTAAFTFDQALGSRWNVFAEGYYANRDYVRTVPSPALNLTVPNTNAFYVRPAGAAAGTSETVQYSFANDYGATNSMFQSVGFAETYHLLGGFNVGLPRDWQLEFTGSYGYDHERNSGTTNLNTTLLNAALASNNPATAFNPFGTNANNAALLSSFADQIAIAPGRSIQRNFTVKADGKLFGLPGGDVGLAVGGGKLYVSLLGGQITGSQSVPRPLRVFSDRDVDSTFAELSVPIVGAANGRAGLRKLGLSLAVRSEKYSDFGRTTHPKYGISWGITDAVSAHASYGTSFRAPGLSQLRSIAAPGIFLQNYSDPLANNGAGGVTQGAAINGGNVNLGPESATTWSFGLDWASTAHPGMAFSVNYFNIEYSDQVISYLSNLAILQNPVAFGAVFQRRPSDPAGSAAFTAMLQGFINEGRTINGGSAANVLATNVFVDGRPYNYAITKAKGLDFDARYRLSTSAAGTFNFALTGTYFMDYFTAATATAPLLDELNRISFPLKARARLAANWSNGGGWGAGAYLNYTNGYINDAANPVQQISAYQTLDLRLDYNFREQLSWSALHNLRVGLDVSNAFDSNPPFANVAPGNNGGGGFDPNASNPVGRLVAFSIGKRF